MLVLGIESSCDEMAASVVRDGREIVSSRVHAQTDVHAPYGGVVPELASRDHVRAVSRLNGMPVSPSILALALRDSPDQTFWFMANQNSADGALMPSIT